MSKRSIYVCMSCDKETPRDDLVVKRAVFALMGKHGKLFRSRTLGFLCPTCLECDSDYNRVPLDDAPGHPGRRQDGRGIAASG